MDWLERISVLVQSVEENKGWDNHEDSFEETLRREMLKWKGMYFLIQDDMKELTQSYYKVLKENERLKMDFIDRLREELKIDEGCKYEVYLDHLGLPTFGIGHLITKDDPEYQMGMGTPVDEIRVNEVFEQDINVTIGECRRLFDDWDKLPEEVQLITANMMFNMGRPRLSQFKKMIQAIRDGDWIEAGNQMQDSRWYKQVTNRADRLISRMKAVGLS